MVKGKENEFKRGRFGNAEAKFVRENLKDLGFKKCCAYLNRDPVTIRQWILDNMHIDVDKEDDSITAVPEAAVRSQFRTTLRWQQLTEQFTPDEVKIFEYEYSSYMTQFNNNVQPTEESTLFLLIKYGLLIDRNLKDRQRAQTDVDKISKEIESYGPRRDCDKRTQDRIDNLDMQLTAIREADTSRTKELSDLRSNHSALMKELKATREQRISLVETAKESFVGLIKAVTEDEKFRMQCGFEAELMVLAEKVEEKRLGQDYEFADGQIDKPLLTAETLEAEDIANGEAEEFTNDNMEYADESDD